MASLAERQHSIGHFFRKEIWATAHLKDRSPRGWLYATLRVISITWTVFNENKAASRAAALSFSSLLGLGPLIAIGVLVGGFMLGQNNDPHLVANKLSDLITLAAPQLAQLETINNQQADAAAHAATTHGAAAAPAGCRPAAARGAVETRPGRCRSAAPPTAGPAAAVPCSPQSWR